jgi:hypothetical protein
MIRLGSDKDVGLEEFDIGVRRIFIREKRQGQLWLYLYHTLAFFATVYSMGLAVG